MIETLVIPIGLMAAAMIIQRRTNRVPALWLSFGLAIAGGIVFARSGLGATIASTIGSVHDLLPVILGAALFAVAATDAVDGRPDEPATIAAFVFPMFAAAVMSSPARSEALAIACLIAAGISQHRAHGHRAGQIKWASLLLAGIGGVALLNTPWPGYLLGWLPGWLPGIAGLGALTIFAVDVLADKRPDRPAIIAAAVLPALLPFGWALLETGLTSAVS